MGFHHIAFTTKDTGATHRFYTEVMGFRLVKVVASPTPGDHGGWSKHFFYDTGAGGMIAFWELHDDHIGNDYPTDLNTSIGLPPWVNHFAFDAPDDATFEAAKQRWLDAGMTVPEVFHGFCKSIYATDPNGIMVEWCMTLRDFAADEIADAQRLVHDPAPTLAGDYALTIHRPTVAAD